MAYSFNPFTGNLDKISVEDLSNLVPYTGATSNVDLGDYSITADSIIKSGATADDVLLGDGTTTSLAGIETNPAGSDGQIQFNNNGTFGAVENFAVQNDVMTIKGDLNVTSYGANIITNGDFATDLSGWDETNPTAWYWSPNGAFYDGTKTSNIRNNVSYLERGSTYQIRLIYSSPTTRSGIIIFGGTLVLVTFNEGTNNILDIDMPFGTSNDFISLRPTGFVEFTLHEAIIFDIIKGDITARNLFLESSILTIGGLNNSNPLILGDTGGIARGQNSIDIQRSRVEESNVASGMWNINIGNNLKSSSFRQVNIGNNNFASREESIFIGRNLEGDRVFSILMGQFINETRLPGSNIYGNILFGRNIHSSSAGNIVLSSAGSVPEIDMSGSFIIRTGKEDSFNMIDKTLINANHDNITMGSDLIVDGDMELLEEEKGIILKSPNGTRFKLTVDNSGEIISTQL